MSRTPPQRQPGRTRDSISGRQSRCLDEIIRLNKLVKGSTGSEYYLYTSRPGDGQTRCVFTDGVVHGYGAALAHMQAFAALKGTGS